MYYYACWYKIWPEHDFVHKRNSTTCHVRRGAHVQFSTRRPRNNVNTDWKKNRWQTGEEEDHLRESRLSFGPVLVKWGRSNVKWWVALFTCSTTRAIHGVAHNGDTYNVSSIIVVFQVNSGPTTHMLPRSKQRTANNLRRNEEGRGHEVHLLKQHGNSSLLQLPIWAVYWTDSCALSR